MGTQPCPENPVTVLDNPSGEEFIPKIESKLALKPLPLVLSLVTLEKGPTSRSAQPPFRWL